MIPVRPKDNSELTEEEKQVVLRALGYYQVHLFDEMASKKENDASSLRAESQLATSAIKKIHKTIEK